MSLSKISDSALIAEYRRRFDLNEIAQRDYINSSAIVKEYLWRELRENLERNREHFLVIYLDGQNRVITIETLFTGSLTSSAVYPREVIKAILKHEAAAVVLAHNHPSGSTTPSASDRAVTQKLKTACEAIDVQVLDHIIIGHQDDGEPDYFSFADHRMI